MEVVLLSEGRKFESFYEEVCEALVQQGAIVRYVSLGNEPPVSALLRSVEHEEISGIGSQVNYLKTLRADIVLTAITSLGHPRFPRSKSVDHYSHFVHSLNSPIVSYRKGSFDEFDSIHSASGKMSEELESLRKARGLKFKIYESGYTRLSFLYKKIEALPGRRKSIDEELVVTVAPSWGKNSIFEERSLHLLSQVAETSSSLYLRPHPMSEDSRNWRKLRRKLTSRYSSVQVVADTSEVETLLGSDLLITDWSGTAMEYALTTSQRVIYIDLPQKEKQRCTPQERSQAIEKLFRDEVGIIWDINKALKAHELEQIATMEIPSLQKWKSDIYHLTDAPRQIVSNCLSL